MTDENKKDVHRDAVVESQISSLLPAKPKPATGGGYWSDNYDDEGWGGMHDYSPTYRPRPSTYTPTTPSTARPSWAAKPAMTAEEFRERDLYHQVSQRVDRKHAAEAKRMIRNMATIIERLFATSYLYDLDEESNTVLTSEAQRAEQLQALHDGIGVMLDAMNLSWNAHASAAINAHLVEYLTGHCELGDLTEAKTLRTVRYYGDTAS